MRYLLVALVVSLSTFSLSCEKESSADPATGSAAASAQTNRIQIKGSDSEVNAVQRLAEAFMKEHPDAKIAVTGGGSGTGISALVDGTIDIANSSRAFEPSERLRAKRAGVDPVATIFATDALSIIVHPDNPVKSLTLEQLKKIFSGEATDWAEFGGEGKITAYGRQPNSGTYVFFKNTVVDGDFGNNVRQMNGSAQIVESVATDEEGIGYVAVGYLHSGKDSIKPVAVASTSGEEAVMPTNAEAVRKGSYPIARPLYQYTNGEPEGIVREFLKFELSEQGQKMATEMGFYPVMDRHQDANAHLK